MKFFKFNFYKIKTKFFRWFWTLVRPEYIYMVISHKDNRNDTVIAVFYNGYVAEKYCKDMNEMFKDKTGEWFSVHGIMPTDVGS